MWNVVIDAQVYVVEREKVMLNDWQDAHRICDTSRAQPRQEGNVKWIKPAEGRFKCNIDASFSQLSNRVGIWVCIRDDRGTFVLAKTEWFTLVCEVHVGEALGLLSTLECVHHLHLDLSILSLMPKKWWIVFHLHVRMLQNLGWLPIIVKLSLNNTMSTLVSSLWGDK